MPTIKIYRCNIVKFQHFKYLINMRNRISYVKERNLKEKKTTRNKYKTIITLILNKRKLVNSCSKKVKKNFYIKFMLSVEAIFVFFVVVVTRLFLYFSFCSLCIFEYPSSLFDFVSFLFFYSFYFVLFLCITLCKILSFSF